MAHDLPILCFCFHLEKLCFVICVNHDNKERILLSLEGWHLGTPSILEIRAKDESGTSSPNEGCSYIIEAKDPDTADLLSVCLWIIRHERKSSSLVVELKKSWVFARLRVEVGLSFSTAFSFVQKDFAKSSYVELYWCYRLKQKAQARVDQARLNHEFLGYLICLYRKK